MKYLGGNVQGHSSQQVRIKGGIPPLSTNNVGSPANLSSEVSVSEKITENCLKGPKIAKNEKSCKKVSKIGPKRLFERFLSVLLPHKAKGGSNYTILYHFAQHFLSPKAKNG
jgi:hypothetical protein